MRRQRVLRRLLKNIKIQRKLIETYIINCIIAVKVISSRIKLSLLNTSITPSQRSFAKKRSARKWTQEDAKQKRAETKSKKEDWNVLLANKLDVHDVYNSRSLVHAHIESDLDHCVICLS